MPIVCKLSLYFFVFHFDSSYSLTSCATFTDLHCSVLFFFIVFHIGDVMILIERISSLTREELLQREFWDLGT